MCASYTGGANKRMKKYPSILSYLEAHYPDVFQLIEDLGMYSVLYPHKGRVTFIIPDKSLTSELKKMAESDEPEKATDIISYLALTDLFTKPADFEARKNNIYTRLGRRFVIKSVTADKVLLPEGEIKLDTDFKPFERSGPSKRDNMAVWLLKGRVDPESAPVVDMKELRARSKGEVTGGDDAEVKEKIRALRAKVFEEHKALLLRGDRSHSAYLTAVSRVARVFKSEDKYRNEYVKLRSLITAHPVVDFYLLFACTQVFDPELVLAAYSEGIDRNGDVSTIREICADFPQFPEHKCALFDAASAERLSTLRDDICAQILNRFATAATALIDTYDKLDADNTLYDLRGSAKISDVYPAVVHEIFRKHRKLHLLIDQFAWDVYRYLARVEQEPDPGRAANLFEQQIKALVECYYPLFANPEEAVVFDKPGLLTIDKKEDPIAHFLRTFALKLPCCHSGDRAVVGSDEAEDPFSQELVDVDAHLMQLLEKLDDSKAELTDEDRRKLRAIIREKGRDRVLEELS